MIGQNPMKFLHLVLALSFLWFLKAYFFDTGIKIDTLRVSLLTDNLVGTHESKSVDLHGNIIENGIRETDKVNDSRVLDVNVTKRVSPIDNFFTGGDWERYLDQISKELENKTQSVSEVFSKENDEKSEKTVEKIIKQYGNSDSESCSGRFIYIHDLPTEFNEDLLKQCESLSQWSDMCFSISNLGFGPEIRNPDKVLSNTGWYETNQFMLEVIFHNRMKQYKCLTNDSSMASAIFVPYYSGLDVGRYLWRSSDTLMKDYCSVHLVKWLREKPEWKRMYGRDHFLVAGRITWDFRRLTDGNSDWGNKFLVLPESENMTTLTIESSPWHQNDFAIPYPTYFHPSSDFQAFRWQNKMRKTKRQFLFAFAGASRPQISESIRGEIINQCQATKKCKMLDCSPGSRDSCSKPDNLMKIFQNSIFCLQPSGDSYTRRSTFDSILTGCIPVFFHPGSAYVQYLWHLPKDYTKYSVFIPENEVKNGKASIEKILSGISKEKILEMREQVIKLIPGIVYADPSSHLETLEDAFDITVDRVLERIDKIRKDMRQGKDVSDELEEFSWKKILLGSGEKHEWDHFFKSK